MSEDEIKTDKSEEEIAQFEAEMAHFKRAYRLTVNSMAILVRDANELQTKIAESKTAPKKELYTKKFNKVKEKFQDELARMVQLEHILKENGIDVAQLQKEDVKSSEEQLKDYNNGDNE